MMSTRRLILLELNEINFEIAQRYVEPLGLHNFGALFERGVRRTSSESEYELLEPWIQWVSARSGLSAAEHSILRLGDIVGSSVPQILEDLEARGLTVGAISPMNAENRLSRAAYFLPDPWTKTANDGSFWSRILSQAISQAVNDNSDGRITARSAVALGLGLARFARARHYGAYARLALGSKRSSWRKALLLDLFLHDLHWTLLKARRPHFSEFFLNAGAHIQHHYYLSSEVVSTPQPGNPEWYLPAHEDPVAEMLQVYDTILGDYLDQKDYDLIVATGLTQKPYDRVKFYYRLKDHAEFLKQLGIRFERVVPRMTRDFLIEFASEVDAIDAAARLAALKVSSDGLPLFGEIDNRGDSLFVTLTYPNEVSDSLLVFGGPARLRLAEHVVFVAIKNGMHSEQGYICCRGEVSRYAPADGAHIKTLHSTVTQFFNG